VQAGATGCSEIVHFRGSLATLVTVEVVPENGVEPSRSCDHWILSPARLPVPPLGHGGQNNTMARRASNCVFRKSIQQRRQHVIAKMKFELLHSPEMLLACRTAGLNDLVLRAHKSGQIVALYFFSNGL
jgi:hypothetical protein